MKLSSHVKTSHIMRCPSTSQTFVWPADLEMAYLPITSSLFYKALKSKTDNFIFRYNKKLIWIAK